MNTSLTAYTHLESLLLFQSLHAYGLAPHVFLRVSELLKSNPHITADKRFESGRLSPDALRNFYLHILKEEIRSERDAADPDAPAPADPKGSRKRKAPSPSLPTVQESAQHQHLIPHLVNKLYARYRAAVTEQIRHDEERYDRLLRELHGIERGEWDAQLKEKAHPRPAERSPSQSTKSPPFHRQSTPSRETTEPAPDGPQEEEERQQQQQPQPPPSPPPAEPKPSAPQNGQPQTDSPTNAAASPSPRKKQPLPEKRPASSTPQPPVTPSKAHAPPPTPTPTPANVQAPPSSATQAPNGPPPASRPAPTNGQPQPQLPAQPQNVPSPRSPHPPHPQPGARPGAPPPLPGQPYGHNGLPHYAGPPPHFAGTPSHPRYQGPPHLGPQSPGVHTPHQQRHYPPYAGHPPYPPQQQFGHPPPPGGIMLPPFQVSPQDPSRAQQPIHPQYPHASTPVSARQQPAKATPQSAHHGRQNAPPMHHLVTQVRQPVSTPTGVRTPQSAFSTPLSAKSQWKASGKKIAVADVSRPEPEPIDDYSSTPQQSTTKPKPPRKPRAKPKSKEKEQESLTEPEEPTLTEDAVPEVEPRQGRSRRKAPAKRARPGSIASSQAGTSVRERTRSPSVLSHTDTIAADTESQAGSRVKSERGTPMDVAEDDLASTPQMTTRRRGNPPAPPASTKRKRGARETTPPDNEPDDPPQLPLPDTSIPHTVIAPRHFSRMCTPLMNDIASHKHASTFTTAVRAKDAEGYYDIIKRPTDLKSIQKAIAAGAKQLAAAASASSAADTPSGSPGGPAGAVVELPALPENMPPKAIVNSAQLEKEIMRLFVNAVMFNPGEEGVVEDAREMYESVGRSVSSWRSVERGSGRLEVEEMTPVAGGDEDVVAVKRRKI